MRIAIIGRTEILYETALRLREQGHEISLFITAKEAPEYNKKSADFCELAEKWGIPFFHTPQIKDEIYEAIRDMAPMDIGISLNYTGVISQTMIDLFPLGILNAHGGDLPRYRGNACQAWAIINGEERVGLCVHRMVGGELDSGDIVARDYFPLSLDTKVTLVYQWMSERIPSLFSDALQQLEENSSYVLERQSKNPKNILRCYPRKPEDGRIDFGQSAEQVLRLINASGRPFAGAYGYYKGQKVIIHDARLYHDEECYLAMPGQIAQVNKDNGSVVIITGNGKLELLTVETTKGAQAAAKVVTGIRNRFC
jgi:methionyl-tRNA formyltransferase